MDKFKEDLLSDFVLESREHLESVEPNLLDIEQHLDEDSPVAINDVFRAIHSLKGSAAFFGFDNIKGLAHVMENLLMKVRDHEMELDKNQISILLSGTDKLRLMVEDLQNSDNIDTSVEIVALQKYLDCTGDSNEKVSITKSDPTHNLLENKSAKATSLPSETKSEQPNDEIEALRKIGNNFFQVTYSLSHQIYGKDQTPQSISELLQSVGKVLHCDSDLVNLPLAGDSKTEQVKIVFTIATVLAEEFLYDGLEIERSQVKTIVPDEARTASKASTPKQEQVEAKEESEVSSGLSAKKEIKTRSDHGQTEVRETLRVDVKTLNKLMDLAGELVLNRNQLKQVVDTHGEEINSLTSLMQSIDIVTSDLQATIMNARLQPIGVLFNKFPRIIRDLASQLSKEIDLVIEGKDVDMDKSIIETLSDPLTHLIRNCADHAIEMPDIRIAANKPSCGKVVLRAYHKSGQVYIDIIDDGAGIDPKIIKAKVLEKELKTVEELQGMSETDILKLIFLPGFSTATVVTEVSGRGVGMDVVRTNIEKLGGSIHLESKLGEGSTITLKLPLTLAIIPSQIIAAGGVRYAVPQINLVEMVQVGGTNGKYKVEKVNNKEVLRLRGELLPLVDMMSLLKYNDHELVTNPKDVNTNNSDTDPYDDTNDTDDTNKTANNASNVKRNILVLAAGATRFGLIVSELLDSEEIVVKPLSSYMKACRYYAGATILGDGKVSMILDVAGIAETAHLDFDSSKLDDESTVAGTDTREISAKEQFFMFENGENELFALPLQLISRVDKIRRDELKVIDGKTFFSHSGNLIRLVWLHDYIQASAPANDSEHIHVIIPKVVKHTIGICATSIHDIVESSVLLNCRDHNTKGVVGSAMIDNQSVIFLDLFGLFEIAAPDLYDYPLIDNQIDSSQILIADSNPAHSSLLAKYCESAGLKPMIVSTGMEAFQELKGASYRIVLTALNLSIMDPVSLISQTKAMEGGNDIRFIALTDLDQKQQIDDIYSDHIMKFDKHRLLNVLGKVSQEIKES